MTLGRWPRRLLILLLGLGASAGIVWGALHTPAVYFRLAFFIIQRASVMRDRVDWVAVRAEADLLRRDARSTADTYPAIRRVLQRLGDRHSHLAPPDVVKAHRAGASVMPGLAVIWPERIVAVVLEGGAAEAAGVKVGDVVEAVNGAPPEGMETVLRLPRDPEIALTVRTGAEQARDVRVRPSATNFNRAAVVRPLADGLGYVEIPGVVGGGGDFDTAAITAMRALSANARCGWVIDLRRNVGGNMWPMMHAVRPILGEATPGYFVSSDGREPFSYQWGKSPVENAPVYRLERPDPPVAVLTSRLTVSSGEALTIAFRGRPRTRSFGEPTAGLPTANQPFPLPDGAVLQVTTAYEADRTGRVYEGRIPADEQVGIDWGRFATEDDPVLVAAAAWLRAQAECAGAGER